MPENGAFNQTGREGQTAAERNSARARADFAQTPEGQRIVALEALVKGLQAKVAAFESLLNNLTGQDGITIALPVIGNQKRYRLQVDTDTLETCDGSFTFVTDVRLDPIN